MRRLLLSISLSCFVSVGLPVSMASAQLITVAIVPPELPVYEQPPLPAPGYIWTPGYWAYGDEGYYWVPGTWVEPPRVGLLWTPGYWGWREGSYVWNAGYWGPHVGFYGGINYGFGYGGGGYEGGYWNNGVLTYNRTVNNFGSVTVTNVYSKTVVNNTTVTNTSFNGGTGGATAQPTPQEQAAAREQHVAPTPVQAQHQQMASTNKGLLASQNNGHPAIAATSKPNQFSGPGVVAARETKPAAATPATAPMGAKPAENKALENKPVENNAVATKPPAGATVGSRTPANAATPAEKTLSPNGAVAAKPNAMQKPAAAIEPKPSTPPSTAAPKAATAAIEPKPAPLKPAPPKPATATAPRPATAAVEPHPAAPKPPAPPKPQVAASHPAPHPAAAPKPKAPPPEKKEPQH